jgi:rRNA-processing protein FCF1
MDANALMMPVECDVRVFEELDRLLGRDGALVTPRAVLDELDRLAASGNGREATAASVGADLARERCRVRDHEAGHADGAVYELATGVSTDRAAEPAGEHATAAPVDPGSERAGGPAAGLGEPIAGGHGSGERSPGGSARRHASAASAARAARDSVVVVTNDRPLRERLLDAGVSVIGLRGRNALELTHP